MRPRHLFSSRFRRRIVNRLVVESLESRQLLSLSSVNVSQMLVQPNLTAAPIVSHPAPTGLTPSQVRQAYGLNQVTFQGGTIAGDGTGQTIAIVVAYDDQNVGSDLKQFDRQFALADPPSFIKYVQSGLTRSDSGWALETSLDVEWAHATAPKANIALVEAKSASLTDLFGAVNFARSLSGVVAVSMSWGTNEFYGETSYDSLFTTPAGHVGGSGLQGGVTFVAASGDSGAWGGSFYPAVSPNVLSVGATTLNLGANGSYGSEQGWTGSTGGFSALEPVPSYQAGAQAAGGLSYGQRTTPDVSAVGNPATGISVYDSVPNGGKTGWYTVGGTSASAPQWAGVIAIADQGLALAGKGSLANAQATLYSIPQSSFHDVTSGFNGYSARLGYDLVSGLGTPVAPSVVSGLLASQHVSTASALVTPRLSSKALSTKARIILVVSTGASDSNTNTGQGSSGSIGPTSIFPVFPLNIVVIVVPVGSTRIIVILPPPVTNASLFASSSHPVQTQVLPLISLPTPSQPGLNQFGQELLTEPMASRASRFSRETEVAALIDMIEPLQPPGLRSSRGSTSNSISGATVQQARPDLPAIYSQRFSMSDSLDTPLESSCAPIRVTASPVPLDQDIDGSSKCHPSISAVASIAAIAGGSYWLAFRNRDLRRGGKFRRGSPVGRSFKPVLRRLSLS
jgi:hypothetical protein